MRGVANLMRGKKVSEALVHLDFVGKRAAAPIKNLLASALANAKNLEIKPENLVIKTITVNVGKTLKRHRPVSHGSAHPIHKRTSHIFIELGEGKATAQASSSRMTATAQASSSRMTVKK